MTYHFASVLPHTLTIEDVMTAQAAQAGTLATTVYDELQRLNARYYASGVSFSRRLPQEEVVELASSLGLVVAFGRQTALKRKLSRSALASSLPNS